MASILTIDHGTQSVRCMLFDGGGRLLGMEKTELAPYRAPHPGWAEQDADYHWDRTAETCRRLLEKENARAADIAGVAVTSQRSTVVFVDAEGAPLRPAINWYDRRLAQKAPALSPLEEGLLLATGLRSMIGGIQKKCQAHWIRQNEPDVWRRMHKYLLLSGYLIYRITGRFVDSVGSQVGYIPFDYRGQKWPSPGSYLYRLFQIDRKYLPDLAAPGEKIGAVSERASLETGIPAGVPVVAAASDQACEMLGVGAVEPGQACLSFGTILTFKTPIRRYVEVERFMPPYAAAVPGGRHTEVQLFRGFWLVSWFKREFAREMADAGGGPSPEERLNGEAAQISPGCEGLALQPYWSPGVRKPGKEARGAIVGFREHHTRAHMYRALLEGLAFAQREAGEKTARRTGQPLKELRASGGGARSELFLQIVADVFNLSVTTCEAPEASGLGAAIDAAVGLGMHPNFDAAVKSMVRLKKPVVPNPKNVAIYDALYSKIYKNLYKRIQPTYLDMQEIF